MDDRPGCLVPLHLAPDVDLVVRAREGDRTAFGVLYLRHHAAAWRLASATSAFSDDAELAVLAGFTAVFPSLPVGGESSFRAHLLTCVRRAALQRARTRQPMPSGPAPRTGNDGTSSQAVRAALSALPEPRRTALWLTDVEAMTPSEVATVVGLDARSVPRVAGDARARVQAICPEIPLTSAADPPPLLGGECQRHWLTHRDDEEARTISLLDPDTGRAKRRRTPLAALATAVTAMVLGLPLGGAVPRDRATTIAVSPAVRAYLPVSDAR
jgi:DNA-directed RNA polymerase specialized sigma24 family protein